MAAPAALLPKATPMSKPLILVSLDGTFAGRAVLPVATALAKVIGANLCVIHVSSRMPPSLLELATQLDLERAELDGWSLEARIGEPPAAIIEAARSMDARLIVMCTHTSSSKPATILGHTALDVLRAAPCSVVLVPPAQPFGTWWPHRVLLAHDGSPTANAGVVPAVEFACATGAELLVVQVGTARASAPAEQGSFTIPLYVDQPQHEWPSWSKELLERLACLCPGGQFRAQLYIRSGEPGPEIRRLAVEQSTDLIVLVWKGKWDGDRAKALKTILSEAPCPIMIIRV